MKHFKAWRFLFFLIYSFKCYVSQNLTNQINYWAMNNLSDVIGGANLYGGSSYSFVPDRFCSPNSAIFFNNGYLQVPSGVYFSGDFTVTAWINIKSYQSYSRIFEFGNGKSTNNIILNMYATTSQIEAYFADPNVQYFLTKQIINLNQWYFVAFVLNGTTGYIYVNGNQVGSNTLYVPTQINRTQNFIGKSRYGDPNPIAIYDEIQIYQGAISSNDIMKKYNSSSNNGINIKIINENFFSLKIYLK